MKSGKTAARLLLLLLFLLGMPILALPRVQDALCHIDTSAADTSAADTMEPEAGPPLLRVESPVEVVREQPPAVPSMMPDALGDASQQQQLASLRQRLVDLGVTYVKLERIGMAGARYRCTCHMPVAVDSPYREELQAVATNPIQAMRQILADIEHERPASPSDAVLPRPTVKLR